MNGSYLPETFCIDEVSLMDVFLVRKGFHDEELLPSILGQAILRQKSLAEGD
ncbi:hypothetical protein [Alteribacillus sp. HJP-4]|uniref:hypothetical protein n=1 Tax=Alteribacillus sp. HJP-4 TaxID=2775394 RepID=UPI0035CD379D